MELFWKILPFLIPLIIAAGMYRDYKNQDAIKVEKRSWLQKQPFYQYIKLVFYTRPQYNRKSSLVWFYSMVFSLYLFFATFAIHITKAIYPDLPLEKMQIQQGVIESITLRKNMNDLLILRTYDGVREEYGYLTTHGRIPLYIDKNVTVYYSRGFDGLFIIENRIHQIITNDTHTILDFLPYDYERVLRHKRGLWSFTRYLFYVTAFSAFMLWRANRKELPIHRLNRIKRNRKNRGRI
ncbi:MAG: hypothetical protein PHQ90_11050 [Sulfuricurvum sp.]|uniref:hypothetical protein n=1 Tax=Sulfuricurvum sp. TaxID=2025608 RepID=UPI002633D79B|nr:hypothetical protein [Sulfuricurvum sp.]MDD2369831.1 hypothetical protein [Sulfuricurvum sp.]MDD5118693.1 hypothetical protein [Sulfuricurvum sp.]